MSAAVQLLGDDEVVFRRTGVRFPVELRPEGVVLGEPSTWPVVVGRLEALEGRLLYMPPCADKQQYVASDVVFVLRSWTSRVPGFVVGGNEAGMKLGGDVRAADAAVWRRADVGSPSGRVQSVPPVLAVEVAGQDEGETELLEKARWYARQGVPTVWLVLPDTREVVVLEGGRTLRCKAGETLPEVGALPGLRPLVDEMFRQLDG